MKTFVNSCIHSLLILLTFTVQTSAEELKRRASWQATFLPTENIGMAVKTINAESPLAQAGIEVGDIVLSVDNQLIEGNHQWYDITDNLTAGRDVALRVKRESKVMSISLNFPPLPLEQHSGITTEYGVIENDYGVRQRTIVTYPTNAKTQLPAIFMLQGLSCSSIESLPNRTSNYIKLLTQIVRQSDMLVMRVEKPGLGDSEGECSKTDFKQEINGYERTLQTLMDDERVDAKRIIIYGNSMGSALAPYFVNKYDLNGLISDGTFFRSWFEHMLEIERRIKVMQGLSQSDITQQMNQAYIPLYYGMLIQKQSYADLIQNNPLLAQYNYHGLQHMYGRPMSYYHQVQDFDFAGEWQKVKAPVRIRRGQYDWIMSESDNHMIVETLKKAGNTNVELAIIPKLDHWATLHESPDNSFNGKPGTWDPATANLIVKWAKELNKR
ncbi:PDZ domain-containing protein [Alteromonadaceae bacterium M269]|nr:PDZ domain-containing protein [Alteromonadaceae bacterium M269]